MNQENQASSDMYANRNFKDTIFRKLFQEKEAILQLYNAVNDTHYLDADQLEIVTLENAIYMSMKNDLAFLVDFQLHMYEHQSTVNPNMPLRFLQYVSREFEKLMDGNAIYRSKQMKLPTPHFVVFYNGNQEQPERQELFLSSAYEVWDENPNLELKVLVLNINHGKNQKILEQCQILKEYMQYVDLVRTFTQQMKLEQAVETAIEECIQEGILKDFLTKNRAEAKQMSIFEYHEEEVLKLIRKDEREEGWEEGREVGKAEGREEGQIVGESRYLVKQICRKLAKGKTVDEIAKDLEETAERIQTISEIAILTAPKYDVESICKKLMEQHQN